MESAFGGASKSGNASASARIVGSMIHLKTGLREQTGLGHFSVDRSSSGDPQAPRIQMLNGSRMVSEKPLVEY